MTSSSRSDGRTTLTSTFCAVTTGFSSADGRPYRRLVDLGRIGEQLSIGPLAPVASTRGGSSRWRICRLATRLPLHYSVLVSGVVEIAAPVSSTSHSPMATSAASSRGVRRFRFLGCDKTLAARVESSPTVGRPPHDIFSPAQLSRLRRGRRSRDGLGEQHLVAVAGLVHGLVHWPAWPAAKPLPVAEESRGLARERDGLVDVFR
jgi:hypothetical protein